LGLCAPTSFNLLAKQILIGRIRFALLTIAGGVCLDILNPVICLQPHKSLVELDPLNSGGGGNGVEGSKAVFVDSAENDRFC